MKVSLPLLLLPCLLLANCATNDSKKANDLAIPAAGYSTPETYPGKTLVWQDEFSGSALNTAFWNYETGGSGWGNHELEFYQQQNTSVKDGYLIIEARQEKAGDKNYTSSRLKTQGKKDFQFGRVDIRALLPKGQGIWPALWMLGSNIDTVGWPVCGEIDIMEMIGGGGKDSVVHGTAHWDNAGTHASEGGHKGLTGGHILADQFHVYSIIWTNSAITWYLDDVLFKTVDITPADRSELKNRSFFLFNVAVGGDWPGSPDATTAFPQRMVVDYIRVFQ
jgi:beta-glucanase (GH16 family)